MSATSIITKHFIFNAGQLIDLSDISKIYYDENKYTSLLDDTDYRGKIIHNIEHSSCMTAMQFRIELEKKLFGDCDMDRIKKCFEFCINKENI